MRFDRAITELVALKQAASSDAQIRAVSPAHREWKIKVTAVLERSLGVDSSTVQQFKDLRYHIGIWSGAPGEAEQDRRYFAERVDDAIAIIDAAIYELDLLIGTPAIEGGSYDTGLWNHVKHSVEEERWEQVASAAAIFVEDKVRRWSGTPLDKYGKRLVGQALFAKALAADGPLALGGQINETEGWRSLGTGLVAALSNVDRHSIQERPDAKQYALGVLGISSLLLTQIKFEHGDAVIAGK